MNKETSKEQSIYSPAETNMIMCMTRSGDCTPEKCLTPNSCWKNEEARAKLIGWQKEWEVIHDK